LRNLVERAVPIFVILVVAMMVVPLPGFVLDLLLAANFSVTIGILLLTMYTKEPLEFSVFPSLLLMMTLFRLALNISATRMILLNASPG
jgi:flagellar biosynthesis protein FlhA